MTTYRIYVDNRQISNGTPWVLEFEGGKLFASSVRIEIQSQAIFDPTIEQPKCALLVSAEHILWNNLEVTLK